MYFRKEWMRSMNGLNSIRLYSILVCILVGGFAYAHDCDSLDCEHNKVQDTPNVQIGQTLEFLLASEGDPSTIVRSAGNDDYLHFYYYHEMNTTYIVNTETGYICDAAMGKLTGNCLSDTEQKGMD
tara:strand:+ start:196761 stop:197138 length:378 start_codon:yes stop_codon:yes gene_type:complete